MKIVFRLFICSVFLFVTVLIGKGPDIKHNEAYVVSDIAPLRKVIVLPPGNDFARLSYQHYSDVIYGGLNYDDGAIKQHEDMVKILENIGIEVLNVIDLIEEAITEARIKGKLEQSLKEIFPSTFPLIKEQINGIDALSLLGRRDAFYYHYDTEGRLIPLIRPSIWIFYTRDFAVTTPKGIIITNSKQKWRRLEHSIVRFMFSFAPSLRECQIVFDAEREGVRCEGGDIIVKDENTILMGINNYSDAAAAKKIAQKLDMDVIGVSMPPYEEYSGVNLEIMHLDTVFNLIDRNKVLTVPYLFEKKYSQNNPIAETLKRINEGLKAERENVKDESDFPISLEKAIKYIPQVGWLTLFRAGTGEEIKLNKKLVDYMKELNYKIIWVGGDKGDLRDDKYIVDRVFYELSLQATNVVQLSPGKVLAYTHNKYTIDALVKNGVEVLSFEGKYLADNLGGPHCLTMPLERR
jgi:arginine deiminase